MHRHLVTVAATLALFVPSAASAQQTPPSATTHAAPAASPSFASASPSASAVGTTAPVAPVAPAVSAHPAVTTVAPARAPIDVRAMPVAGTPVQAGRVSTVVAAPFSTVAAVLTDFPHYRDFLPRVAESRVVRRNRGQVDLYLQVPLLQNLGVLWALARFDVRRTPTSLWIDGRAVNGNVARFEYHVEAAPVGPDRTQVTIQLLGVPAFPFPTGLLSSQQGRWAARGLAAMRDRAELSASTAQRPTLANPPVAPAPSQGSTGGGPAATGVPRQ